MAGHKEEVPFEKRLHEAQRILAKYPERIPVICEKALRSDLPEIEKKKFLVPGTMLLGELKYIIHKHLNQCMQDGVIGSDQTIYLLVNNTSPKTGALMSEIYDQYQADDGFLYITYTAENTLGFGFWEEEGRLRASCKPLLCALGDARQTESRRQGPLNTRAAES